MWPIPGGQPYQGCAEADERRHLRVNGRLLSSRGSPTDGLVQCTLLVPLVTMRSVGYYIARDRHQRRCRRRREGGRLVLRLFRRRVHEGAQPDHHEQGGT
jgi:hypothetical protein